MKNTSSIVLKSFLQTKKRTVLLFDSITAASDIAFILKGEWDGCNGVVMSRCDEVAVSTAASLMQAAWCYQGASLALLSRLTTDKLLHLYTLGERNFINVNLRCAELSLLCLSEVNFSWAKLNFANIREVNLSKADLTRADFQNANLDDTNLSQSRLVRANLASAKLRRANLKQTDLSHANLSGADLTGAIFDETILTGTDLSGALFDH